MTAVPLALVTGTREHLGAAAAALGRTGFAVTTWESNAGAEPAGPFDCYLQLPCGPADPGGGGRVAAPDLVGRIDALAAVAGRLGPDASVLLGVEDAEPSATPSRASLASDLLAAVALALLEDLGRPTVRVTVLPVADLCRAGGDEAGGAARRMGQWEMPTPPLVSAP